jgi:group I intron endonuclease
MRLEGVIYLLTVDRSALDKEPKFYVGKTFYRRRRKQEHFKLLREGRHGNGHLQRAWWKYGEAAFSFSILQECSRTELLAAEQAHLDRLRAQYGDERILNICKTCVDKRIGVPHTEEVKAVLSAKQRELWQDEVYRAALMAKLKEVHGSPEARARQSRLQKEAQARPEVKAENRRRAKERWADPIKRAAMLAAFADPILRAKKSIAIKRVLATPECAAKRKAANDSGANDRRKATMAITNAKPEVRRRRSEAGSLAQGTAEMRERQRIAQLIAQNRPETKARKSASMRIALADPEDKARRALTNARPEVKLRRSIAASERQLRMALERVVALCL